MNDFFTTASLDKQKVFVGAVCPERCPSICLLGATCAFLNARQRKETQDKTTGNKCSTTSRMAAATATTPAKSHVYFGIRLSISVPASAKVINYRER